jgi:hypothetical protein
MKRSEPYRNEHIISDLMTSQKDWMIFPEGIMVKEKDISKIDNIFCVKIDIFKALLQKINKNTFISNKIILIK